MTDYAKKLISNSVVLAIASFLSLIFSYLLRVVLAKNLSVSNFGLIYAIISLFTFFSLFQHLGLNSALVRYISKFNVEKKYGEIKSSIILVFSFQFLSSFFISLIFFLSGDYLAVIYFK